MRKTAIVPGRVSFLHSDSSIFSGLRSRHRRAIRNRDPMQGPSHCPSKNQPYLQKMLGHFQYFQVCCAFWDVSILGLDWP